VTTNPRQLKLVDLLRLLNSTPLGEVIVEHQLKAHRNRAGLRIGDSRRIDLVRYVGWLVLERHQPKTPRPTAVQDETTLVASTSSAAALVALTSTKGRPRLSPKQEGALAALLSCRTYAEAAERAGVSEATLYRWMNQRRFRAAFRRARQELMEAAVAQVQAAAGQAVETLVNIARSGRRDADRVRAATTILNHSYRGLEAAEMLHGTSRSGATKEFNTSDVVKLLAARLQQIDHSELPAADKARLLGSLSDSLLRAFSVDVLDKRLEALQTVLVGRKEEARKRDAEHKQRRKG
jgi:hypothetical protein